jgi:two-component system sensor histidine kinase FlrB
MYLESFADHLAEQSHVNQPRLIRAMRGRAARPDACAELYRAGAEMTLPLRDLLDALPGGVIVLNAQGRIEDCNVAALQLLGEPLRDESWRDVVERAFEHELDQGELRTRDGRQFSISTRPLGFAPGQVLLLSDVTQTRQLQRAAQQNLHLMTMGRMVASLAHQIRTPLSSSMLYLSQVVDGAMDLDKTRKFSGKALARIRHIEKLINDMLVFAHGGQFHTSEFSLPELMTELREQLAPLLQQHDAALEIHSGERDISVHGNRDALLGALANLCMNAIDARQGQLVIKIAIESTRQGRLRILVEDNGRGMDEATLAHLFDPFFTTKQDGTGLGLAVVKSVIESHQGFIEVQSQAGQGCCFTIELPSAGSSKTQLSGQSAAENQHD